VDTPATLFSVAETAAGMLTGIAEPIATEEDVIRNSRRVGFSELDMSGPWDLPKLDCSVLKGRGFKPRRKCGK
jgi:hypothetical protein